MSTMSSHKLIHTIMPVVAKSQGYVPNAVEQTGGPVFNMFNGRHAQKISQPLAQNTLGNDFDSAAMAHDALASQDVARIADPSNTPSNANVFNIK